MHDFQPNIEGQGTCGEFWTGFNQAMPHPSASWPGREWTIHIAECPKCSTLTDKVGTQLDPRGVLSEKARFF